MIRSNFERVRELKTFCLTLLLFLLLILSGCKTVKTAISTDFSTNRDSTAIINAKIQITKADSTSQNSESKTIDVDSSKSIQTDIYFSIPDSSGKQYIERITTTDATRVKSILTTITGNSKTIELTKIDAANETNTHVKSKEESTSKTKIEETPITKWPLLIISIGILMAGYFVLKRFKLL